MGLDQYAYAKTAETGEEGTSAAFTWRKHSKLQEFMETLFTDKTDLPASELNCGELILSADDIEALELAVANDNLPESAGGFFYGHQFQDEAAAGSKAYDLEFVAWAKSQISEGATVAYSCWW